MNLIWYTLQPSSMIPPPGNGKGKQDHLVVILISPIVNNVIKPQFVDALRSADNTEPVAELVFLEVLFSPKPLPPNLSVTHARKTPPITNPGGGERKE